MQRKKVRRKIIHRYSFDRNGHFLGRQKVDMSCVYLRRIYWALGAIALAVLTFLVLTRVPSSTTANKIIQIQLPL